MEAGADAAAVLAAALAGNPDWPNLEDLLPPHPDVLSDEAEYADYAGPFDGDGMLGDYSPLYDVDDPLFAFGNSKTASPVSVSDCLARAAMVVEERQRPKAMLALAETGPVMDTQPESLLVSLPWEVLGLLAGFLDGPSAQTLFSACRELFHVGREATTRIEFLLGRYGTDTVVDGLSCWLAMLTPKVLDGVCRRITANKVPRCQLQRLFRRFQSAGRTDLLPVLLTFANHADMYPTPSPFGASSLPTASGRSGRRGLPPVPGSPGLSPALPDETVFRRLVISGRVPNGLEYLVQEGLDGGWAVPADSVLTALLTLKLKYGFPENHPLTGRSKLGRAVDTLVGFAGGTALGDPRSDIVIPGTDSNHALLIQMIREGNESAVKWLLTYGVRTSLDSGPLFEADAVQAAERSGIWGSRRIQFENLEPFRVALNLISAWCARHAVSSPYPPTEIRDRGGYGTYMRPTGLATTGRNGGHVNVLDAVEYAASMGRVGMVRLLLQWEQDKGRWFTAEGKSVLKRCLQLCSHNMQAYEAIRSYYRDGGEDLPMDLLGAFLAGEGDRARELIAKGATLSAEQATHVLTNSNAAPLHDLLIESSTFDLNQLQHILPLLWSRCAHPNSTPESAAQYHPAALAILRRYENLWADKQGKGRQLLMRLFATRDCAQHLLRPYLGATKDFASRSPVLTYDMMRALENNDVEAMKALLDHGVRASCCLSMFGRPTFKEEGLITLLGLQRFTEADLEEILIEAVYGGHNSVVAYLLDSSKGHKPPMITGDVIQGALDQPERAGAGPSLDLFRHVVERAAEQSDIVFGWKRIRRIVNTFPAQDERREIWQGYEDKFPDAVARAKEAKHSASKNGGNGAGGEDGEGWGGSEPLADPDLDLYPDSPEDYGFGEPYYY